MLETLLLLIVSLAILAFSAEIAIANSINLARFLRISEFAIGFLLVSVATSLPELLVSVFAGASGETGIALGNVFGSNIANLCFVIGVSVLFGAEIVVKRKELRSLLKILFITSLIPLVMLIAPKISFYGIMLIFFFLVYAYYVLKTDVVASSRKFRKLARNEGLKSMLLFLLGMTLVVLSSHYAVDSAILLSEKLNVAKSFIGATIVALGTSLPEVVVGISAIRRKRVSLALGNVLGSSITNLTLVLGAAALFSPIIVQMAEFAQLIFFALLVNVVLWEFIGNDRRVSRNEAAVLLAIYLVFVATSAGLEIAV